MAIIKDAGTGSSASVDSSNRLQTFSVSQREDKRINYSGKVWSCFFSATPVGADDYFFYLKNEGSKDIYVTDIRVSSSAPTALFYDYVSGTPSYVGESPATITSRNLGKANLPDITANYDSNITGLVKQGELFFEECTVADARYKISTTSNIIVPQGQALAFRREAATGTITAVVSIVESE